MLHCRDTYAFVINKRAVHSIVSRTDAGSAGKSTGRFDIWYDDKQYLYGSCWAKSKVTLRPEWRPHQLFSTISFRVRCLIICLPRYQCYKSRSVFTDCEFTINLTIVKFGYLLISSDVVKMLGYLNIRSLFSALGAALWLAPVPEETGRCCWLWFNLRF